MLGFTNIMAMASILSGDFEEGLEWAKRSLRLHKLASFWSNATLASAYANLGRMEEAREALRHAVKEKPNLSISYLEEFLPTRHKGALEIYLSGLRSAGLPE